MQMDRQRATQLGRETVEILAAGRYTTAGGRVVEISDLIEAAVAGTRSYPPDTDVARPETDRHPTMIEVANETTLVAARKLIDAGYGPAALNFAAATHPGGGFLSGARAQEESLCRSSGLYACLDGNPMYDFHRQRRDAMYSDYVLYSPDVPVIRTDDGELLGEPYLCSFITSPAVNAQSVLDRDPSRGDEIRLAMRSRIAKVLAVAARHEHETLVLGAWGCGAFGNDGEQIAGLFHGALQNDFRGVFSRIVFAVTDWSDDQKFIGPFQDRFA